MTLATVEDVLAVAPEVDVAAVGHLLESASETIRKAAGHQISETTTTFRLHAHDCSDGLRLPTHLVTSIEKIEVDGVEVDGWTLVSGRLWRRGGWGRGGHPVPVDVTCTHGYPSVPVPLRDLAVQLVLAALHVLAEDGMLGVTPGIRQESISSNAYAVTYGSDDPVPSTVFELSTRTERWIASTYGLGTSGMVTSR